MENISSLIEGTLSWTGFFTLVAVQVALFFLLRLADRVLVRVTAWGRLMRFIQQLVHYILLIYEPLAVILIASAFVWINPPFHGLMLALLLMLAFGHLRNYISGRLLLLNPIFAPGRRMSNGPTSGIITDIGRQGIALQTTEGLHFVRYAHLIASGYTIDPGDEIGGYFNLKISTTDKLNVSEPVLHFQDLLSSAPYIDRKYKPEINTNMGSDNNFQVKVLLQEENHLYELMSLIQEWGYDSKILQN